MRNKPIITFLLEIGFFILYFLAVLIILYDIFITNFSLGSKVVGMVSPYLMPESEKKMRESNS